METGLGSSAPVCGVTVASTGVQCGATVGGKVRECRSLALWRQHWVLGLGKKHLVPSRLRCTAPDAPPPSTGGQTASRSRHPLALTLAGVPPAPTSLTQTSTFPLGLLGKRWWAHPLPEPTKGQRSPLPTLEAERLTEERQQEVRLVPRESPDTEDWGL